jgi:hypothetical protein
MTLTGKPPSLVKRVKTVLVEYWDCGIPTHNHRTKDVAAACMAKRRQRAERLNCSQVLDTEQLRHAMAIAKRIISGETFAEVGNELSRSGNRVRQVFCKVIRQAGTGQVGSTTVLPPAKHLAYGVGVGVASVRGNAEAWLTRLAEMDAALVLQESAVRGQSAGKARRAHCSA